MLKRFVELSLAIALAASASTSIAAEHNSVLPESPAGSVQFKIKICEAKDHLQFWFNDEAKDHWGNCKTPVPDVPVFLVTDSGQRREGKTAKDGVADIPEVTLRPNERFRMAMACTTHNCFSLHGMFLGDPWIKAGLNTMYAETGARHDQSKQ